MKNPRMPKAAPAMPPPDQRVVLCVVGAPHGVRGECRVKSFTENPLAIADYGPLFAEDGRMLEITSGRLLKDDMLVVAFKGVTDRDHVQKLTNLPLFVARSALPPTEGEDEFYHADLIGLEVMAEDGTPVGTLLAIQDFGGGDILEIRPITGGPTWLQPFTKACVPLIDLAARRIIINPAFLAKPEPYKPED